MKRPLPHFIIAFAAAMMFNLMSSAVSAQDERWFKVELMIFSARSEAAATAERWPPTPSLQYPDESRFLLDPERIGQNAELYGGQSSVDEFGRQTITLDNILAEDIEQPLSTTLPVEKEAEITIEIPPPVTPTPFTVLGADARELSGGALGIQRSGNYTVIFHETWVQPVDSKDSAIPIVIDRSGDDQAWPQLQGSIKLYVARFLHIETNLWLNTMGQYLPETWLIPAPPLGPLSLIIEQPEQLLESFTAQETAPMAVVEVPPEDRAANVQEAAILAEDTAPIYPWQHAILLQQKRKMRSTEVHYIDHPMLGVVALLTPLSEEDLATMAATEFVNDPNQPVK